MVTGARSRAAEYLLAAQARHGQPSADDFMLLAEGNDLNPTMINRWQTYLTRTKNTPHSVFAPWHALAAVPATEFAAQASQLAARCKTAPGPAKRINPVLAQSFAERPPTTLPELAKHYGELLTQAESRWQEALRQAAKAHTDPPSTLTDPAWEELRQVLYAVGAAPNVPLALVNDLELLPDRASQGKVRELRKAVEDWRAKGVGAPPRAMALEDSAAPYEPRIFVRGSPSNLGPAVPRQFLDVLSPSGRTPFHNGSGRLELAQAIARRDNPLTARVLVNRVWLHHFGQGLVRTPSDFGLRSEPPSHPELLDYLAADFMDHGWSIKRLHRQLLLSATYRQASTERRVRRDAENVLLWRMNRRRLDFESLRDTLLAVSGRLHQSIGGPPVRDTLSPAGRRRTLYGHVDRMHVPGIMRTFDFPSPDVTSSARDQTTVPPQALFMMNNPLLIECARGLATRPDVVAQPDDSRRIHRLFQIVYGRSSTPEEAAAAQQYLNEVKGALGWTELSQALLLTNEFAFVD